METTLRMGVLIGGFIKWAIPSLFFKQALHVNNVHLVYGAGIQTHDLRNMSLLT